MVCDEWRNDRTEFFKWALDNNWNRALEIDRINNNEGYSPENCRLVTHAVNMENRRCTVWVEYNGIKRTVTEWSKILGLKRNLIKDRLRAGKSIEYALFEPVRKYKYYEEAETEPRKYHE